MPKITIELNDAQIKALMWDCVDIEALFIERANVAVRQMATIETEMRLQNGDGIPPDTTPEELVLMSEMPNAVERNDRISQGRGIPPKS